jgi:hypothetical protein
MKYLQEAAKRADISRIQKERDAIKWCIAFPQIELDALSRDDFFELVSDYDRLIADPNDSPYLSFSKSEWRHGSLENVEVEEAEIRESFKKHQTDARILLKRLSRRRTRFDYTPEQMAMNIEFRIDRDGKILAVRSGQHGFDYCFAGAIMNFFNGHKFTNRIAHCQEPTCNKSFPVLTKRGKQYCSRKCSMNTRNKKKVAEDPELVKKVGRLKTRYYLWKNMHSKETVRKRVSEYIEENNYEPGEIPKAINNFLKQK